MAAFYMRDVIDTYVQRFDALDTRTRELLRQTPDDILYEPVPVENKMASGSIAISILRSAAMVEKTFGGITTRLWDDPFEWTLPEKLNDRRLISAYLDEVVFIRRIGFGYFTDDADLQKQIPAPISLKALDELLSDTLSAAEIHLERAAKMRAAHGD